MLVKAVPSLCASLLALSLAASPALAAPGVSSHDLNKLPSGDYIVDKTHASLTAKVRQMGFSQYTLRFTKIDASFSYDPASPSAAKIAASVDPASIDTGSESFNKELGLGASWLNGTTFPKITFVSTEVSPSADGKGTVTGDLTFLGVTKPVVLNVTWNGVGNGMLPGTRTGFSATAHIKRTDFGNKTYVPIVGDDVDLLIEVEFTKKP